MIRKGRRQNGGDGDTTRGATEKVRGLRTYNLQFDCLAFELNSANLEVDANRGDVAFCIGIVCKTEQKAGLVERRETGKLVCSKDVWNVKPPFRRPNHR